MTYHLLSVHKVTSNYVEYDQKNIGLFLSHEEAEHAYQTFCKSEFPDGHRIEEVPVLHIPE